MTNSTEVKPTKQYRMIVEEIIHLDEQIAEKCAELEELEDSQKRSDTRWRLRNLGDILLPIDYRMKNYNY